jgi:UDP-N-acetyl-D-mannosaminuronic acid dehydrogenase
MLVPNTYSDRLICVIGLGYVGMTLAAAMCDAGFKVHGVERDPRVLKCLGEGRAQFLETGLDATLARHVASGALTCADALEPSDTSTVFIVTVGTPVTPAKKTNLQAIQVVAEALGSVLKPNDMVILRSTVRVGVTRGVVKPVLDRAGVPYDLAFCPERTLEGRALEELRTLPQIVGGLTEAATLRARQIFGFLTPTVLTVDNLETAEIIKLVNNTQRDYMFAFANEVAEVCDKIGVSAQTVIRAGSVGYPRALPIYPGPVGGPCLEKDPYILAEGAKLHGAEVRLALEARRFNEALPGRSAALLAEYFESIGTRPRKVVVFGLAFKGRPETSDLRGSMAYPLIAELRSRFADAEIGGFDPSVDPQEARSFDVTIFNDAAEAAKGADILFFQTNNPQFQKLDFDVLRALMKRGGLIYDYWDQFGIQLEKPVNDVRFAKLGTWSLSRGIDTREFTADSHGKSQA